jgi:hypothetical protein
LRFIVWSFLKARLQFSLDQFNGATSDAVEAIDALREVLQLEDLLVAHDPKGHS